MVDAELDLSELNDIPKIQCDYSEPRMINANLKGSLKNRFSIMSVNIRSCRKNFSMLLALLAQFVLKITIIVLVETWLCEDINFV